MRAMLASFVEELGEVDFTLLYQFRDRNLRLSFNENVRDLPIIIPPTEALGVGGAGRRKLGLMVADGTALVIGIALAFALHSLLRPDLGFDTTGHASLALTVFPGFAVGAAWRRLYQSRANERPMQEVRNVSAAVGVAIATVVLVAFLTQFKELSRLWVALLAASLLGTLLVERAAARRFFERLRASGRSVRHIVIVGTDAHAIGLINTYERNPHLGYRVIGLVGPDPNAERSGVRLLGSIDDIDEILLRERANGVVMSLSSLHGDVVNSLTRRLTDDGYHVALSSMLHDIDVTRLRPQALDGRTMLYVEPVYVQAVGEQGFPLLRKVLVGYGQRVAMEDTLLEALEQVFDGAPSSGDGDDGETPPPTDGTDPQTALTQALLDAQQAYDEGQAALAAGDFGAYGDAQERLKEALDRAAAAQAQLTGDTSLEEEPLPEEVPEEVPEEAAA